MQGLGKAVSLYRWRGEVKANSGVNGLSKKGDPIDWKRVEGMPNGRVLRRQYTHEIQKLRMPSWQRSSADPADFASVGERRCCDKYIWEVGRGYVVRKRTENCKVSAGTPCLAKPLQR